MKLSILVPVYNEEVTVEKLLRTVNSIDFGLPCEIVVVNDGSTDKTYDRIVSAKKTMKNVRLISYEKNRGKGYAIRKGISGSKGDVLIIQDADLEYSPRQIKDVIKPIVEGKAKVVFGSRFMGRMENMNPIFRIGNMMLTLAADIAFLSNLSDIETCYKAMKRDALKGIMLKSDRFDIEAELACKILKKGIKIMEVPISYKARTKKSGKKIDVMDGIKTLGTILKVRFDLI